MVSVFNFQSISNKELSTLKHFVLNFYCIVIKKNFTGKMKYGQWYYDYDEGMMSFMSPNQLLAHIQADDTPAEGICLLFHPDFLVGYDLAKRLKTMVSFLMN